MRFSARKDPQNRRGGSHPQIPHCFALCLLASSWLLLDSAMAQKPTEKAPIRRITRPPDRFQKLPDLVCNEGTEHECICNRSSGNLDGTMLRCYEFIQIEELKVVTMTVRNINLTARLHTSETYESYFKRRIANIVSGYCQHQAHKCPGVQVRVPKVHESDVILDDYDEPLLTQDNVILLQVEYSEPATIGVAPPDLVDTSISFVVAKAPLTGSLDGYFTIPSQTIEVILGAQMVPLSRILGGVRIKDLKVTSIVRPMPIADNSNTRLKVIVALVATFFLICYAVAIYRICRETRRKRRAKKREAGLAGAEQANYGACTDKLLQNDHAKTNGRRKSPSNENRFDIEAAQMQNTTFTNLNNSHFISQRISEEDPTSQEVMDPRRIQRMFDFDPSQLPAEPSFDEEEDYGIGAEVVEFDGENHQKMDASVRERSEEPRSEALSIKADDLPSVVVLPSSSIHESRATDDSMADQNENYPISGEDNGFERNFLSSGYDSPPERPRSRRGSREHDEEDVDVESPLPLGDRLEMPHGLTTVPKSHTAHKFGHWSSDDSDVEHSEVYNKLAEEDDDVEEPKRRRHHRRTRRPSNSEEENSAEEDEENVFDRHHYERLQESPMPPVSGEAVEVDYDSP